MTDSSYPQRRVPPPLPARKAPQQSLTLQQESLSIAVSRLNVNTGNTTSTTPIIIQTSTNVSQASFLRLLARKPPPPPVKRRTVPPIPKVVTQHTTQSPPQINRASRPQSKPVTVDQDKEAEATPQNGSCLQCRDFSMVDTHASQFPRSQVRSIEELAYQLTEPFEDEVDKARVIFAWLHYNIAYDAQSFFGGTVKFKTPSDTLASGLAVCDGYAGLFETLADYAGLTAHKVTGHGKGYGYAALGPGGSPPPIELNHAWNCVQINGEWHLVDSCWGSGVTGTTGYTPRFAERWFTSPPTEFVKSHFPSDPSFQLTPVQVTWEEYILAPELPVLPDIFFNLGLDAATLEPATKHIPANETVTFTVAKRCEHMSTAEKDNYAFVVSTGSDFIPMVFDAEYQCWWATAVTPSTGGVMLCIVNTVEDRDAKGLGFHGYMGAKGRMPLSFKSLAMWTTQ